MQETIRALILACRRAFDAGDFIAVLELTARLTAVQPDRPEAWRVRAEALVGLGRHAEAHEAYAQALERSPADAQLHVRRARALARCGRHAEARTAYETAFAAAPSLLAALHGLIGYRAFAPDDPALAAVRAIARGAPATPGSRAFACFLLGRILTTAGRDAEGFALYAAANHMTRDTLPDAPPPRWPDEFLRWWAPRAAGAHGGLPKFRSGTQGDCPALLVTGLPRSGKSLVEHLLCTHPALAPGEELGGLHEAVEMLAGPPARRLKALDGATEDRLAIVYAQALVASDRPSVQRIVDTAPPNLWDLGYLAALHPEVPLILCQRDPLDLGAAIFFKRFSEGHAYSYDQVSLGGMLAAGELAIEAWRRALPNPIQVVDYQALVADPVPVRDALLRFLGLDPAACAAPPGEGAAMAGWPGIHASHNAPAYGPVVSDLVGFGKRFAAQLAPMMAAYRQARG